MRPDYHFLFCQACNSWKQFISDETWGTREGRAKLFQDKLLQNWMNDDATLTRVGAPMDDVGVEFFVCNDQHIFCDGGDGGTNVFDMSGKRVRTLGEDEGPISMVAVGKEILAAATGRSTIGVWSTSGEMEKLHHLQLEDFGVDSKVVVVDKMPGSSNKVIILTFAEINDITMALMTVTVTEMGENGRWKDKILAKYPVMDTRSPGYPVMDKKIVVAGRGDWIATASMKTISEGEYELTVALWREDKRLPDVILHIASPGAKLLTGISIEHTMEGFKLVISMKDINIIGAWAMLVYNMVPNKTAADGINLDLIKTVRSDGQLWGSEKYGQLISTDLILGYFAPAQPTAFFTLYEKKKMLDTSIVSEDVRARQISLPYNCPDDGRGVNWSEFGFNLTHIVCRKEEDDDDDGDDDYDGFVRSSCSIFMKDFGLSTGQPDEVVPDSTGDESTGDESTGADPASDDSTGSDITGADSIDADSTDDDSTGADPA